MTGLLFQPIQIGNMQVRNRWVMSAMTTNYADEQTQAPSPRLIEFIEQRAKGGVGLITAEVCTVDPTTKYQPQSMTLGSDEVIEAHRQLTEAVHRHGAKIQPQLTHPGPEAMTLYYRGEPAVGPSPGVAACHGMPSREVLLEELDDIVELYAQGAYRARTAGYDGIELHAAHAYMLLGNFLSPLKNKRLDEYGCNTPEDRIRLLLRVLRRIKDVAGSDFPITLRISGFERIPGGRDFDDTATIAPQLVAAGVDAFHVSGGVSDPMVSQMICGSDTPNGYNLPAAEAIRRVVDVPVMVVGRILDPEYAEQILNDERADMIVMGRPFLADPEIVNKTQQGQFDQIRRCISCQNCIDSMFLKPFDADMHCSVNAATGREQTLNYAKTTAPRHIVVVGGGPAGMEAARVACERGHRVTLIDQRKRLGGSLLLAATVHQDNERFLAYLQNEMKRLPIALKLGTAASAESVQALNPDAVIVATGARVSLPPLEGINGANVITGTQLRALTEGRLDPDSKSLPLWLKVMVKITGGLIDRHYTPASARTLSHRYLPLGKRVLIIGADLAAIEVAEFLARRGRLVSVFTSEDKIAPEIGPKRRLEHEQRLEKLGVSMNSHMRLHRITPDGLEFYKPSGGMGLAPADTVVVAGEVGSETSLYESLKAKNIECHAIGDCTGLGLIVKAITEGNQLAHQL